MEAKWLRGCGAEREAAPQPRAVEATVCVEVLRACGLAAGVCEAAAWLGGGEPLTFSNCYMPMPPGDMQKHKAHKVRDCCSGKCMLSLRGIWRYTDTEPVVSKRA